MKTNKPLTITIAIALGLVSTGAIAAQPVHRSVTVLQSSTTASDSDHVIVSRVRKVYLFSYLDRDHNGQLSRAELPKDMHNLRRNFLRADFNENGQLSPREYLLYSRGEAPQYTGISRAYTFVYTYGNRNVADIENDQ